MDSKKANGKYFQKVLEVYKRTYVTRISNAQTLKPVFNYKKTLLLLTKFNYELKSVRLNLDGVLSLDSCVTNKFPVCFSGVIFRCTASPVSLTAL